MSTASASTAPAITYHDGLDGLRALSITAVVLFHAGVGWAVGGFLGVEAFFVVSGFLITSLLIAEWGAHSGIALGAFWSRRARRLLPALTVLVLVISIYYAAGGADTPLFGLRSDVMSTIFYVSNWHQIAVGDSYFAANGPVSPLEHTWSLAIEEQFYLVWPLIVFAVLALARRISKPGSARPLQALLVVGVVGVVASVVDTILRIDGGRGLDRVYYGSDTRAAGLLVGGSLAVGMALCARRGLRGAGAQVGTRGRVALGTAALLALGSVLVMMRFANGESVWLYPYGLLGLDAAVSVMIVAIVVCPRSPVGRLFTLAPVRSVGKISYGIYLWHFPLFVWLDTATTGLGGTALVLFRVAATLCVSVVSFHVVEQPIRRRRIPRRLARPLPALIAAAAASAVLIASIGGSVAAGLAAVPRQSNVNAALRGSGPACAVTLTDTPDYGLAPLTPAEGAQDEPAWLVGHRLEWRGSSRVRFFTCPPRRVLLVGDSIAFTLGVGIMENEQNYGVEVADAAILGCAFTTAGELNSRGKWEAQYAGCPTAAQQWQRDERALHAQAVVVELGYRDEFDWLRNGRVVHLGDPGFDAYVQQQIDRFVQTLGASAPILFLSVPWTDPAPMPDGSPAPAASPARHALINSMLRQAVARDPSRARFLNIDSIISPGNHYQATVNGNLCRFDGVHLTIYCARLLQQAVLTTVRSMTAS